MTPDLEAAECSDRGVCDRTDGICTCFAGFGASDGHGHQGTIDDCGYVLPLVPNILDGDAIAPPKQVLT